MKIIKQLTYLSLILLFLGTLLNCSASTETQNRKVKEFTGIQVSSGIDLYLTMGNEEKVTIVADNEIIDDIVTEVKNGILNIYMKNRLQFFRLFRLNNMKAYVTAKLLEELDASAGSDVVSENTITGNSLKVHLSSGSDLKMDVDISNLSLKSSSGSDAKLTGRAENFDADASSGSDINASGLKTRVCHVEASSGSDASVYVTDEIVAHASSGSDISYQGNPQNKDTHESSGGDIHQH